MKKTILIAAVMFFAFSVAASAQALFQVGSTPVTTVTSCGKTEMTGDIVFTTVAGSLPVLTGTITINYGVPVSSTVGAVVEVTANGVLIAGAIPTSSLITSGNYLTIPINVGAGWTNPVVIRVSGVKVDVSGSPTLQNLVANVTGTINTFVGGQTSVVVISSIASALSGTMTVLSPATNISSIFPAGPYTPSARVTEGYLNAWVLGSGIQFNFTAIPAGLTFTFPNGATTPAGSMFQLVNADLGTGTAPQTVFNSTSGAFSVFYRMTTLGTATPTTLETLSIQITVSTGATPLALGSVSVSAQMANFPAGTVPNYAPGGCPTGSAKIVEVVPASTYLLVPYSTVGGDYNTGLAIANTTSDPLTSGNTAKKQSAKITFYFYSQDGTSFQYPAAGGTLNVGSGLTNGEVKTGGLYTVLVSELLAAAGKPATFSGYIIAFVTATNAHGQYFISDFEFFTNGALMLVLNPSARNANAPESLAH